MQYLITIVDGARSRYRNPWNALTVFAMMYLVMVAFFVIGFADHYAPFIVFGWIYFYTLSYVVAAHFSAWACPFRDNGWATLSVVLAPLTLLIVLVRLHGLPLLSVKGNAARQRAYRRYQEAGDRVFLIILFLIITALYLVCLQVRM